MGDSTFRYPPGAPGVRDGGTRPGNRGAGSAVADEAAGPAGSRAAPREPDTAKSGHAGPAYPLSTAGSVRRGKPGAAAGPGDAVRHVVAGAEVGQGGSAGHGGSGGAAGSAGLAGHGAANTAGHAGQPTQAGQPAAAAPAVTYWRRRFVVLAVALATLAVAAWSLSEAFKVQPDRAGQATTGRGPTAGAAAPQGGGSPGTHGHGSASGSRGDARGAGHGPRGKQKASPSHGAFGGFRPKFCSWHSIVVSASANQVEFASGQRPDFSLSVVSTQPTDCSFNVGPGHLALVIKEGTTRIWSSADCVAGSGSLVTALRRGVPTVVAIGWNKKTSTPGCNGPAKSVPAGSYTAYAVDGSLTSAPVTFRLR